jgi:L-fuculose-phosphate aldolase
MLEAEREQVASACRRLAAEGLVVGTAGNVSARAGDLVAITPTGSNLADLSADQVSIVDLEGNVVGDGLEPTSELALHLAIYQNMNAGAVVHNHAPLATALACVIDELPCIHYQMLALGGSVRVAPYRTFGSPELVESVLDALQGRTAALMSNHGSITHAAGIAAAMDASLLLEWACGVYWRAVQVGTPRILGEEQQMAVITAAIQRGYGRMRPATKTAAAEADV